MSPRDESAPTVSEQVSGRSANDRPPSRHRRWPWLAIGFAAGALVIALGAWWLLDSTVPVSDYDDVVAELDATKEALARTEYALWAEESSALAVAAEFPSHCPVQVQLAAPLLGYFAGVEPSVLDPKQFESWSGVVKLDTKVQALSDPELTELYWRHMGEGGFSPGSEELVLRLIDLTIEPCLRQP